MATTTEHFFAADAAIIARLGRELVAKQETALIELVKNSYDADATEVVVKFMTEQPVPTLEIVDNGSGMTKTDLVLGFLRLASDKKVSEPLSPRYKRRRAGRKGIGRFSAHRLGDRLVLTTRHASEAVGWRLDVNWADFARGAELSAIPVTISEIEVSEPGTTIRIEHLFDEWSEAAIKRCWRNVLRLQQPYPVAPVEEKPSVDPGFVVRFTRENSLLKDETVVADLQTEILDHMHAVIEFKVDDLGFASWRMVKNRFAPSTDWQKINSYTPDDPKPGPYKYLRNTWMRTHYVILLAELLPTMVFTRVRDELASLGGVRLYRNGFRVVPYGDPDNDWLGFDELYAKRTFLAPISNRNFFGVVEVSDPDGQMFEEHTSREGLLETSAFAELKHLASAVIVTAVGAISDARGKKTRASDKPTQSQDPIKKLKSAVDNLLSSGSAPVSTNTGPEPLFSVPTVTAPAIEAVKAIADEIEQSVEEARSALADETAMLRLLATLGMTTAEFSHETGMTFDAFRFDFQEVFRTAVDAKQNDSDFLEKAVRAQAMLARLDALTSYLNTLASSRSSRDVQPVSLAKVVEDFEKGIRLQAKTQSVDLRVVVPNYDPLYTRPMHEAEIASILLNLYTNAVKAVKRRGDERVIAVIADRAEENSMVRLRFMDSGDGVPEQNREKIFDAFFTTRVSPPGSASDVDHAKGTGLGLWIVSQIVNNAGGEIVVTEPPTGFSTCFEMLLPEENDNAK
ncbi:ATP-binding protein [Massilia agilis]|uniref:histidine kinase n=1 Tax=Massilia agilis TaxID=1811226 RepID=A0ABT2DEX0_9BURK|nr:sensor histidine kinase [Massilia agilis]MCS0809771.1 ATP-binding protein [Massilia agilis]